MRLSRGLLDATPTRSFAVGGERLRVLMVISRPRGVDERLAEELSAARAVGQPFQMVHFDGHGVLAGRGAVPGSGRR